MSSLKSSVRLSTTLPIPRPTIPVPPEHGGFGPYVPLSSLPSRAPVGSRSAERYEPYYSRLWDGPTQPLWDSADRANNAIRRGEITATKKLMKTLEQPSVYDLWTAGARSTMAAALMWRTLTGPQMAAFSGVTGWRNMEIGHYPDSARGLWSYGFLQTGRLNRPHKSSMPVPTLIRPGRDMKFDAGTASLNMSEWLAITGGVPAGQGSQYARHNTLAAEVGLRLGEFAPHVHAVFGENTSKLSAMTGHAGSGNRRCADVSMVRDDGLRVAFEMTTTMKTGVPAKIDAWISALSHNSSRSSAVVFIAAPGRSDVTEGLDGALRSALSSALLNNPEAVARKMTQRVFMVSWSDWFGVDSVADDFADIPVWACKVDATPGSTSAAGWRRVAIGDPSATPWAPPSQAYAVATAQLLCGSHHLLGVPHFMRDASISPQMGARMDAALVREAGFSSVPLMPFAVQGVTGASSMSSDDVSAAWAPGPMRLPVVPPCMPQNSSSSS